MSHYFVAIPLPEDLRGTYSAWQEKLNKSFHFKKWTHPEDFHITLKFLGEAGERQLKILNNELKLIAAAQEKFTVKLGTIGRFGLHDRPRVLWTDVSLNDSLHQLQIDIEEAAVKAGFMKENRSYRPHMTLAKKWSYGSVSEEFFKKFQLDLNDSHQMDVTGFTLYRIHPKQLPSYEAVAVYSFKNKQERGDFQSPN